MSERIVVTGATGFLGRHLMPRLTDHYGADRVTGLSSSDFDLMDRAQVSRMFDEHAPDVLIHLAAYSAGIGANRAMPADFYFRNTILTALTFQEAATRGIRKLVYTMGGCSYPATAHSPIDESQMWEGYPQPESAGYSAAKKMGLVASTSYRTQYGLNSLVLIPGNMYGEYDNFRDGESHVVPAMVRRYLEHQRQGTEEITMWGTGEPVRDFVYAGDVAAALVHFIDRYDSSEPVNISSGTTTSIRELAETIAELTGFRGQILWDTEKPDGQKVKIFDVKRLQGMGIHCSTPLREGLTRTIDWLAQHYDTRSDGLRL
ncbi:NAD-dependent epimerase/dehydratase family protein [Myxococcota bacterium]|nr:NAD-dependent epimerase/dehydratase family protein [Myxococcota bacterium]